MIADQSSQACHSAEGRVSLLPTVERARPLQVEDLWDFFSRFGPVAFCDVHGVRHTSGARAPSVTLPARRGVLKDAVPQGHRLCFSMRTSRA